ncbi:MAG: hypothetical protein GY827_06355 [Cytophagales bacterium]|nr:hypothetical protein [Cytophagales bacterium]
MNKISILFSLLFLSYYIQAQELILTPQGHSAKINKVMYLNESEALSCSEDRSVVLWNVSNGELVKRFHISQYKQQGELLALSVDHDNKHFFTAGIIGSEDSSYIVKGKLKGGISEEWLAHQGVITELKMLENNVLVSAGTDSLVKFWAVKKKGVQEIGTIKTKGAIYSFDIFENQLVVSTGKNGFDLYTFTQSESTISSQFIKSVIKHYHPCKVIKFSPNGEFILSGGDDYLVNIYDAHGKHLKRVKKFSNAITDIAFSLDNQNALVTTLLTGEVSMISVPKGKVVSKHTELNNTAQCVAFSPASINGNYESLVSGGDNHDIHVFSAINGKLLRKLSNDTKSIGHIKHFKNNTIGINFDQDDQQLQYIFDLKAGTLKKAISEKITPKVHYHELLSIRKNEHQVKIDGKEYTTTEKEGRFLSYSHFKDSIHVLGFDKGAKLLVGDQYRTLNGVHGAIRAIDFSTDRRWLFLGGEHQRIYILSVDSLANPAYQPEFDLSLTEEGEWILWTKEGFFMGSENADKLLGWQMEEDQSSILKLNEASSFSELLYRPDLILADINTRKSIPDLLHEKHESVVDLNLLYRSSPPIFNEPFAFLQKNHQKRSLAPETSELFVTDTTDITLSVSVYYGGGGIEELNLYQNGKLIEIDTDFELTSFQEEVVKEYQVRLLPGVNEFKVMTLNKRQVKSIADRQEIRCTSLNHPVSNLHMLILGVNEYKQKAMNLNYGVKDAQAITEAIQKQSQGIYNNIYTHSLFNEQVTLENIKTEVEKIKKNAKITDVFVLYYAGHGIVYEDLETETSDFYMVLHDCMGDNIPERGFSSEMMKSMLSEIVANKQLVLIDACHSEASFKKKSNVMRRGLAEQQAIYQLARSSGTVIIAACGADQTAKEFTDLGHGAFTYAFIEAIEGQADGGRRDKKITVAEIKAYVEDRVPELTQKHSGTAQYPSGYSVGQDFPIGFIQKKR